MERNNRSQNIQRPQICGKVLRSCPIKNIPQTIFIYSLLILITRWMKLVENVAVFLPELQQLVDPLRMEVEFENFRI